MEKISETISIQQLVKQYPETVNIMKSLGFKDIVKPGMLGTIGRVMTLEKGCKMKNIDYEKAKQAFLNHGIELTNL